MMPICGEPELTSNTKSVKQAWCSKMILCNILKNDGDWKTEEFFPTEQKQISFEVATLKTAMKFKVNFFRKNCAKSYEECMVE